jgi:hypothetical protein
MRKLHAFLIVFSLITVVSFWSRGIFPVEGDYVIEDFQFESGESLSRIKPSLSDNWKTQQGTGELITQY